MSTRTVKVGARVGLHARPAALVAKAASAQSIPIRIGRPGGASVDARSVLSLLALGAEHGDEVVLTAEGDDADTALDALADVITSDPDAGA